jgi:hypothetical protein
VAVDATAAGDVAALAADLDSLGMTDVATAGGLVSGRFPVAKIPALARLPTLRGVVPSRMRTRSRASGSDAAAARPLRPEDADRPPAGEPPPEASGDSVDAPPSPPSGPDPTATASPAAPSPRSSDEAPSPATSPAAALSSSRMLDDAGEASAVLWLLIVLMATVLLLEER